MEHLTTLSDGFPVMLRVTAIHNRYPGTRELPEEPAYVEFDVLTTRGQPLTFKEPSQDDMERFEWELSEIYFG